MSAQKSEKTSALSAANRWLQRSRNLTILTWTLHLALPLIHIILLVISRLQLEHSTTFLLAQQNIAAFGITAATTAFGTLYYAALLFLTQTLSMRRSLTTTQTLTATHDLTMAWSGLTSAWLRLWDQKRVPAALAGILHIVAYLTGISILHITTPALMSLETYNATAEVFTVAANGFPAYSQSGFNISGLVNGQLQWIDFNGTVISKTYALPYAMRENTSVGLFGSTIYDIPSIRMPLGWFEVNAMAINTSCGYVTPTNMTALTDDSWRVRIEGSQNTYSVPLPSTISTARGTIDVSPGTPTYTWADDGFDMIFVTSAHIVDSQGKEAPSLVPPTLRPDDTPNPWNFTFFRCFAGMVPQRATLNSQTLGVISLSPNISDAKGDATWAPATFVPQAATNVLDPLKDVKTSFIDIWESIYRIAPATPFGPSIADVALAGVLIPASALPTSFQDFLTPTYQLGTVQDCLAQTIAAMIWSLAYMPQVELTSADTTNPGPVSFSTVVPTKSEAKGFRVEIRVRLNLSDIAIIVGLIASLLLLVTMLSHLRPQENTNLNTADIVAVEGTGFLHAIWLFRNAPSLEKCVYQVSEPHEDNLRRAGMVEVRLGARMQAGEKLQENTASESGSY